MSDDRKPGNTGRDDPWARFEELDREAGVRRSDLDPLDEEPADEDWLEDDEFLDDDEDALDEEDDDFFDDEVAPLPNRTAADSDAVVDSPATATLRASRDDDTPLPAITERNGNGGDDFDPYDDEDEDEDASGEDEYDDEYDDDESDPPLPHADTYRASSDALQPRGGAAIAAGAATAARTRPAPFPTAAISSHDLDDEGPTRYLHQRREVPWLLLGAGALALVLVLAGGYGVMQQRNDLQQEIRALQARLATTPNTDSIAAAREEQAQLQAQNTELATAYQALQQETERLQKALEELRAAPPAPGAPAPATATTGRSAGTASSSTTATPVARAQPPASSATPAGDWFVNFAAYGNEATARNWANRLKVNGGKVEVQQIQSNGQRLYRVRVSNIASRAEATRIARSLEQEHNVKPWVGQE